MPRPAHARISALSRPDRNVCGFRRLTRWLPPPP
jgi:hypothetical protein